MRSLVPGGTLVYLETNDLAAALQPMIDSKAFTEAAKSKPDISALRGVQVAVAVTGFKTSQEQAADDQLIGNIQPQFVAIADTHAWNFQAVKFAEQKLGGFVAKIYGSEPKLETGDRDGGKSFTWTAADGRKAYALVTGSVVYFANDDAAIEKCLAVRKGEADSIRKLGEVPDMAADALAYGYVSTDGVGHIADILGLQLATKLSDTAVGQAWIARLLPQLFRGTISQVTWIERKGKGGVNDTYQLRMPPDVATVFHASMEPAGKMDITPLEFIPADASQVTRYNLKNRNAAWQSIIALIGRTAGQSELPLEALERSVLQSYGIEDPRPLFQSTVGAILTATVAEPDEGVLIAESSEPAALVASLGPAFNHQEPTAALTERYKNDADGLVARITGQEWQSQTLIVGSETAVAACQIPNRESSFGWTPAGRDVADSDAAVITYGRQEEDGFAAVFGLAPKTEFSFITETRFRTDGMERKTTSDLGFIGSIVAALNAD